MSAGERLRTVWNWHEQPLVVEHAATSIGRVAVGLLVAALVPLQTAFVVLPALALFAFFPGRRVEILSVGAIVVLARRLAPDVRLAGIVPTAATMLMLIALLYLVYLAAREFRRLPEAVQRTPQLWLQATLLGFLAVSTAVPWLLGVPSRRGPWLVANGAAMLLPYLLWRTGYIVQAGKRGSARSSRFVDHFFYAFPVWGGTAVPYGKGYDYLRQQRVEGPERIAASQLAGVKLLFLALLWQKLGALLLVVIHGQPAPSYARMLDELSLGWPTLGTLIAAGSGSAPLAVRWASVAIELIESTLRIAAAGHLVIGVLRLFGFQVFRNTYKPLLATSIVEFWNRFYYYFKELLVEFFFFPAYLRWFKRRPRLRIFTAIMVSVLVGNLYYHIVRDLEDYASRGLDGAAALVVSRAFFCLLLALGIFVSMVREQERRGRTVAATRWAPLVTVRRIAGVWLFYSVIHIWNVGPVDLTFAQRTSFFLGLFGLV